MIFQIAWKNIWRSRIRSLVVIVAVALGMFGGIYTVAVMLGMADQRVQMALGNELGHLQIYQPGYRDNNDILHFFNDADSMINRIETIENVAHVTHRVRVQAMANSAGYTSGVILSGINPEKEVQVFNLKDKICVDGGEFLTNDNTRGVLIGRKLAENLRLVYYEFSESALSNLEELNFSDEIISIFKTKKDEVFRSEKELKEFLMTIMDEEKANTAIYKVENATIKFKLRNKIRFQFQDARGDLSGGIYRVAGVYQTGNNMYDASNAFVLDDVLVKQASLPERAAHEIIIRLKDSDLIDETKAQISDIYSDTETKTWIEMEPMLKTMNDMMWVFSLFFIAIILFALSFGIINTMLMAILERTREIGMLMAVGMSRKRIFNMIMTETIMLTATGAVAGMILGSIVIAATASNGIDLSAMYGDGLAEMGFSAVLTPVIGAREYLMIVALVLATGILASIYPARKALKLNPVAALRAE